MKEDHPFKQRGSWPKLDLGEAMLSKVKDLVDLIAAPSATDEAVAQHCLDLDVQVKELEMRVHELQRAVGALRRVIGSVVHSQGSSTGLYSVPDFELDPTTHLEVKLENGVHLVRLIRSNDHGEPERASVENHK